MVGIAISHLLVASQMPTSNTLVAITNILSLRNTQMTLGQPVREVGVHFVSRFQLSSCSRKDSERVSVCLSLTGATWGVGDATAFEPQPTVFFLLLLLLGP